MAVTYAEPIRCDAWGYVPHVSQGPDGQIAVTVDAGRCEHLADHRLAPHVAEGQEFTAGDVLFHDKINDGAVERYVVAEEASA